MSIEYLPEELLEGIFRLVKRNSVELLVARPILAPSAIYSPPPPVYLSLVKISHVCRRWRDIALNSPALWSDIEMGMKKDVAAEMLARSQSQPISLRLLRDSPSPSPSSLERRRRFWELLGCHMSRVEVLDLDGATPTDVGFLDDCSFPLLHSIQISSFVENAFLRNFLQGDLSSLRVMHITGCSFPSHIGFCPRLVTLKLSHFPRHPFLDIFELLRSLRVMSELELVELDSVLLPISQGDAARHILSKYKPVELPRLNQFDSADHHFDSLFLLNSLRYPHEARVHLWFKGVDFTEAQLANVSDIYRRLDPPPPSAFLWLNRPFLAILDVGHPLFTKDMSFSLRSSPATFALLVRAMIPETIERITIVYGLPFAELFEVVWSDLFPLWPTLQRIDVSGHLPPILNALREAVAGLMELRIDQDTDVDALAYADDSPLISLLRHRAISGFPIKRLKISSSINMDPATLGRLKEYTSVSWR